MAVVASSLVIGVGLPWTVVAAMTAVQRRTPDDLIGRVAATANSLIFATPAFAVPAGAGLLLIVDYRVPIVVAAVVSLLAAWFVRFRT